MTENPVKQRIARQIDSFPEALSALKRLATSYLTYCSSIDGNDTIQIAHTPWVAPLAYSLILFPPAKKTWIKQFSGKRIPRCYQEFMLATNGLFAFKLALFGLTPSLQGKPALLDRTKLQCLDLGAANEAWISAYQIDPSLLFFGTRPYSYTENCGYFMSASGRIQSARRNGEILGNWDTFPEFLHDELRQAEASAKEDPSYRWLE